MNRALLLVLFASIPAPLMAQGYRAALDLQAQSVAWRGWQIDSIPAGDVVVGPTGGFETPDGYAADCSSAAAYCWFYRAGGKLDAAPAVLTTDFTVWGLGVPGLSARGNFRMHFDLGDAGWPGQQPALQFWEGYLDYQRGWLQARAGRQIVTGRVGWTGFDGGRATVRIDKLRLDATAYAGWGLARASSVPVDDPVTAPLGDFIPPQRSILGGGLVSWSSAIADIRAEYFREVDPSTDQYAAHLAALSATLRPAAHWMVTGGGEYDIAQDLMGSADLSIRYAGSRVQASGGYRRYRPIFPLWSVWPAFSPVPYNAAVGSAVVGVTDWLLVRGRVEYYQFENEEASTPTLSTEQDGWRWSAGATLTRWRGWTIDAGYTWERGTGAGILGGDASVRWDPRADLTLTAAGSYMARPLYYRYDDAKVLALGGDVTWRATPALAFTVGAMWLDQDQERPDASAYEWNQTRLNARITYVLSSSDKRATGVPGVIERMPSMTGMGR